MDEHAAAEEHADDAVEHDGQAHEEIEPGQDEVEEDGDIEHTDHAGDDHEAEDHHVDEDVSEPHEEEPAPAQTPAKQLNLPEDWVEKAKRESMLEQL